MDRRLDHLAPEQRKRAVSQLRPFAPHLYLPPTLSSAFFASMADKLSTAQSDAAYLEDTKSPRPASVASTKSTWLSYFWDTASLDPKERHFMAKVKCPAPICEAGLTQDCDSSTRRS